MLCVGPKSLSRSCTLALLATRRWDEQVKRERNVGITSSSSAIFSGPIFNEALGYKVIFENSGKG